MSTDPSDRYEYLAYAPLGMLTVLMGAMPLLYLYAMASMTDPSLEGFEWYRTVLWKMFPAGLVPTAILDCGIAFTGLCVAFAVSGLSRLRPSFWRVNGWAAMMTGSLALIWAAAIYWI